MIRIRKSETADTRTCDFTKVTKETLFASSQQHIHDVQLGLNFFAGKIQEVAYRHDKDKLSDIDGFHRDFLTGQKIVEGEWLKKHYQINDHHLNIPEGVREGVNLIDVLDYITDQVMSQKGRGGDWPIKLSADVLIKAFENTVEMLKAEVHVEPLEP